MALLLGGAGSSPATAADTEQPNWQEELRIEGLPLLSVRIRNDTRIESLAALHGYREARHDALEELARRDPDRIVEVAVTPDTLRTIPEFLADLECDCRPAAIASDVWAGERWLMATGGGFPGTAKMLAAEERRERKGKRRTVRSMRFKMAAADALALTEAEHVLLVDPITEVRDRHRWMALRVEVANAPDVFYHYMQYALGLSPLPE